MIRESYDLDIICYFNNDDTSAGETLKEIYNNVKKSLAKEYNVICKKSALRLNNKSEEDFHIDVVPGRFVDEKKKDVFLFQNKGDKERLKTSLEKHIAYVKESDLTDVIKLVKYWKVKYGLDKAKTFVLELLVIVILKGEKKSENLDKLLMKFWKELRDNIKEIKVEDPANPTGNDLADIFTDELKEDLSAVASSTLNLLEQENDWKNIFGKVDSDEEEKKAKGIGKLQESDCGYQFKIGAKRSFREAGPFQEEYNKNGRALKKNMWLLFYIKKHNIPQPFEVKWRVVNTGQEAELDGGLRGDIEPDKGSKTKKEHTLYRGTHYMDCFAIKNGICVAKDRFYVSIS